MAVNVEKFISAGVDTIHAGVLRPSGRFGGAGSVANGADSGGFAMLGPKSADMTFPEMEKVNVTGGDGRLGTFLFDSETESGFTFESGVTDLALAAASQGTKLHTVGDWDVGGIRPATRTPIQMWWVINTQAKSQDSGTVGDAGWHILMAKLQISYLGPGGISERNPHVSRYSAVIDPSSNYPWGTALSVANNGATALDVFEFFAENRVGIHVYVGDSTNGTDGTATFTLDYKPAGDHSTDKVMVWKDGVLQTATTHYTVTTATSTISLTAGARPLAGEEVVVVYEYTTA